VAILVTAGAQLLLVAIVEPLRRRDSVSTILFLWVIGVFVFSAVINWTVNVRGFLPACPAVAILAVRRIEAIRPNFGLRALAVPIALAAAVTLSLVIADYQVANSMRSTAEQIAAKYSAAGHSIWIEGHQGFQFYLQKFGGRPVDVRKSLLEPGDIVAVNWNSGNTVSLPPGSIGPIETLGPDPGCWMNLETGNQYGVAGFFASDDGPVPFVIGDWRPSYFIAKVVSRVQFHTRPANEKEVEKGAIPWFPKLDWTMDRDPSPPENPGAAKQIKLAMGFQEAGKLDDAVQCYRGALDLDATNAEALNNLAWILATTKNPDLRNPSRGVDLALEATKVTQGRDAVMIGTLAAAFAENGDFSKALATAQIAHDLAQLTGQTAVAQRNNELMDLYARGGTVSGQRGQ
ncbi:MAG: tetratricopeptide repeat protein, partial [Limisphaerales bacterium]